MRIIGGTARGTRLATLGAGDGAAHLRPTSDRVRESLFNVLEGGRFGDVVPDAHVLDLFAGTGALGLEALSRGARQATFVDNGKKALGLLRENLAKTRFEAQSEVINSDLRRLKPLPHADYSLVFLDPPYGKSLGEKALQAVLPHLTSGAMIVWEEAQKKGAPPGTDLLEHRRYGGTEITLLRVL